MVVLHPHPSVCPAYYLPLSLPPIDRVLAVQTSYGVGVRSMETENLKYLTVDQALADVAAFSDFLQSQYQQPLTFFTFGGSYPGALSAW